MPNICSEKTKREVWALKFSEGKECEYKNVWGYKGI